jgi:hypothetical protein
MDFGIQCEQGDEDPQQRRRRIEDVRAARRDTLCFLWEQGARTFSVSPPPWLQVMRENVASLEFAHHKSRSLKMDVNVLALQRAP